MKFINLIRKHPKTSKKENFLTIEPREKFKIIINEIIKPLLKENRFKKQSLTFYKYQGDIIYVINFQKSLDNKEDKTRFYVNCGIYSKQIDKTIDNIELLEPKEYECHYRIRISHLTNSLKDGYIIEKTSDIGSTKKAILSDLKVALKHFQDIHSLEDLLQLMINYNSLDDTLFEYFIITDDKDNLKKQIANLYLNWGEEKKWERIKTSFLQIARTHNKEHMVADLFK